MKAYKGFNSDMTCRGFQYEEGKTYQTDKAELCEEGFHACEYPLDVFAYYPPCDNGKLNKFHEVELDGVSDERDDDTKVVAKQIKIGASINIAGIVKASIEYIKARADKTKSNHSRTDTKANSSTGSRSANSSTGSRSANSATGDWSANSATGSRSANSATGYGSANSATGDLSANSSTGSRSANSATGDWSANSATGDWSANSATGSRSANSATGYGSANSATGDWSANSATGDWSANSATGYGSANISTGLKCTNNSQGQANISVGWGKDNKCKGIIGSYLVLSEWGEWDGEKYPLIGATMVVVDGKTIKEDTFYTLKIGKVVEVEE